MDETIGNDTRKLSVCLIDHRTKTNEDSKNDIQKQAQFSFQLTFYYLTPPTYTLGENPLMVVGPMCQISFSLTLIDLIS